jgi:hypothetical protein
MKPNAAPRNNRIRLPHTEGSGRSTRMTDRSAEAQAALDRLATLEQAMVHAGMVRLRIGLACLTVFAIGWYFVARQDLASQWLLIPGALCAGAVVWFLRHRAADQQRMHEALAREADHVTPADWDEDRRQRWQVLYQERRARRWRR